MGIKLEDPNFRESARFCGFCRNYCEKENHYTNRTNVHSRQALVFLEVIKNSVIARNAEKACKKCDYRFAGIDNRSAGIIKLLEPYGIIIHIKEPLDSSFGAAAQNCQLCYNSRKKPSIENLSAGFAQQCISNIMKSYDKGSKNYKLAFELSIYCNDCDFRDPKIKNVLEGCGIMI